MKQLFKLEYLHVKNHLVMYLVPLIFIYMILMQYQQQIILTINEGTMLKLYDGSQTYLLLFFGWYQYLSWRMILSAQQREVVRFESFKRRCWSFCNIIATFLLLIVYFFWLLKVSNVNDVFMLSVQCFLLSIQIALLMNIVQSSLIGLVLLLLNIFLCMAKYIPDECSIMRLGVMPSNYGKVWLLIQIVYVLLLVIVYKRNNIFEKAKEYFIILLTTCQSANSNH